MTWTDAKIDTITRMWAEGYSSGYIGTQVGKTRNAVIGKLGRMGLIGDPVKNRQRAQDRDKAVRKRQEARARTAVPVLKAPKPAPRTAIETPPPPPEGIPLEALTKHTCRWPLLDGVPQLFCGHHAEDGRYCPAHSAKSASANQGRMA